MSSESTIKRGVRNARYASIPNHVFEDGRLSMEARWLLSYLLSKPDNWTVVIGDIIKKGNCGRDKARKMIAELVEFGYAQREQVRDDGKFGASVLVIFDEPIIGIHSENNVVEQSVAFLPQTCLPATATPSPVSPSPVKSAPSNNSHLVNTDNQQLREGARELSKEARRTLEERYWKLIRDWPGIKAMPKDVWMDEWLRLSDDERDRAERRRDAWIAALRADRKTHTHVPGTYFSKKLFDQIDEPAAVSEAAEPTRGIAKFCGKLWMGTRLANLSKPPTGKTMLTAFDENRIRSGAVTREGVLREKRREHGWPVVTAMRDLARRGEPFVTSLGLVPYVKDFRQVHRDGEVFAAWGRLHERRDVLFIERPSEWVYFPPIDEFAPDLDQAVEAALEAFLSTIEEVRGDDDAA